MSPVHSALEIRSHLDVTILGPWTGFADWYMGKVPWIKGAWFMEVAALYINGVLGFAQYFSSAHCGVNQCSLGHYRPTDQLLTGPTYQRMYRGVVLVPLVKLSGWASRLQSPEWHGWLGPADSPSLCMGRVPHNRWLLGAGGTSASYDWKPSGSTVTTHHVVCLQTPLHFHKFPLFYFPECESFPLNLTPKAEGGTWESSTPGL